MRKIKANGPCPLVNSADKVIARLSGLKTGEVYTYHLGNTAEDASGSLDLRRIIAAVQALIVKNKIRTETFPLLGKSVDESGGRPKRSQAIGGGFNYVAVGL